MDYQLLAAAIIHDAMKEWRAMIRRKPKDIEQNYINAVFDRMDGIRDFLRSPWCDVLMCGDGEGEELLRRLEAEYQRSRLYKQITNYQAEKEKRHNDTDERKG